MSNPPVIPAETAQLMERILYEVKRVVVGQDRFLERVMVALLAQGHLLVEGVPGLAKTLTVRTLAATLRGSYKRIQFTPDLVPADLVGTRIYNQKTGEFGTTLGPVFANLLLADEINRAPAKVQSALLEVMQERQVTIAGETHKVPAPFIVMATQNPIETEGTYPLPEAQVDRFMMKVLVDYPSDEEEFVIVERVIGPPLAAAPVASTSQLAELQQACRQVYVDPSLIQYAVKLVGATRRPDKHGLAELGKYLSYGASPRASIALVESARALAFMRGRGYVLPEDLGDLAPDCLRHRLVLSYEALAEGLTADALIAKVMARLPLPDKPIHCCTAWSGRCCAGSTACCRATTARCGAAPGSTWPTCANTSMPTTCATSTGTSPPACRCRMCASSPKTASCRPGFCWTCRAAWISARPTRPSWG